MAAPAAAAAAAGAGAGAGSGATLGGIGSIVAGTASGGIGLISSIGNIIQNYKARTQNQENWEKTFEYQKELNKLMMEREDNAVQRRAADLAAAGINPMLAGLGGASAQLGGIINPLQQQTFPTTSADAQAGLAQLGEAFGQAQGYSENQKERDLKLRMQENELASQHSTLEASLRQADRLAGEDRALKSKIADAQIKSQEMIADKNNKNAEKLQKKMIDFQREMNEIQNELAERGQVIQLIGMGVELMSDILQWRYFKGLKLPKMPNQYGQKPKDGGNNGTHKGDILGPSGTKSQGGIYY